MPEVRHRGITLLDVRFGQRLREVRNARGLSVRELSARTGIPTLAIYKAEGGRQALSLGRAVLACRALGVDLALMAADEPLPSAVFGARP